MLSRHYSIDPDRPLITVSVHKLPSCFLFVEKYRNDSARTYVYIRVDRDRERMESIEIVISEKRSGEWRGNDIVDRIFVPTSLPFYNTLVKSRFYGVILFIAFEPFPSGVTVNYVALHFPEQTPANLCDVETIFKLEGGPVRNDWTPGTRWKHGAASVKSWTGASVSRRGYRHWTFRVPLVLPWNPLL